MLYPVTMTFATLYLGEHYLLDGLAGMALGVLCFLAVRTAEAARHDHDGRQPLLLPAALQPPSASHGMIGHHQHVE